MNGLGFASCCFSDGDSNPNLNSVIDMLTAIRLQGCSLLNATKMVHSKQFLDKSTRLNLFDGVTQVLRLIQVVLLGSKCR